MRAVRRRRSTGGGTAFTFTASEPPGRRAAEPPKATRTRQLPTVVRRRVNPKRPLLLVLTVPILLNPPRAANRWISMRVLRTAGWLRPLHLSLARRGTPTNALLPAAMSFEPTSHDQKKRTALRVSGGGGGRTKACVFRRVAAASMRPAPKTWSLPGAPRSTALASRIPCTSAEDRSGFSCSIRATRPAVIGVAIDVPERFVNPTPWVGGVTGGCAFGGMRWSHVERMPCPGAETSTKSPLVLNGAMLSSGWVAPTPITPAKEAG